MTNTNGIVMKFGVFKWEDAEKYLDNRRLSNLKFYLKIIEQGRENDGETTGNTYVTINTDESYAGRVIEIMKENGHWG